jgi:sugar lactone lactonase YvrE
MFSSRVSFYGRCGAVAGAIVLLASCGGGGGGGGGAAFLPIVAPAQPETPQTPVVVTHTVGGTVTGLTGSLVLQNNAGDDLQLSANGKFTFATALVEGSAYEVSVRTQPRWQFCTVTQGSGKASADVGDVAVACSAAAAQVSTFAGSGTVGSVNGNGTAASFYLPYSVVVDKSGSLLVSDTATNLVRKISPAGDVTTFAGGGSSGTSQDGNGTAASFSGLSGLALDSTGNAYAAEFGGNRIRKITPAADVTTLAGSGAIGSLDGHGTSATFNTPSSVATDADGNIYVLEFIGAVVRKITPAGDVTTLAGSGTAGFADGTGAAASFGQAYGIATDAAGNVYVADTGNNRIRKITPGGVVTTLAGSGQAGATDGAGSLASFAGPGGLAVDSDGTIYVADTDNSLLRKITPAGVVSTLAGQPGVLGAQNGIGTAATFKRPFGVTVDAAGNLYVADTFGNLIRKVTPVRAP